MTSCRMMAFAIVYVLVILWGSALAGSLVQKGNVECHKNSKNWGRPGNNLNWNFANAQYNAHQGEASNLKIADVFFTQEVLLQETLSMICELTAAGVHLTGYWISTAGSGADEIYIFHWAKGDWHMRWGSRAHEINTEYTVRVEVYGTVVNWKRHNLYPPKIVCATGRDASGCNYKVEIRN